MRSKRWEAELQARAKNLHPVDPDEDGDEFDAVFGKQIAQTMDSYKLLIAELFSVKRSLVRAMKAFWVLSASLVIAVTINAFFAYGGRANARANGEHIADLEKAVADLRVEIDKFNEGNPIYVNQHRRTQRLICGLRPTLPECKEVLAPGS